MNLEDLILWSDSAVLALNKPAGLRTVADGYQASLPHLSGLLKARFGEAWTVHRLDKDTSGIILFALSPAAHRALNEQFQKRETRKEYHAIVTGFPDFDSLNISLPLKVDGDRSHRTVVDHQNGKPAETEVNVLKLAGGYALVAALPRTGYTHQIRSHLAAVGLPILADPLYKSLKPETLLQVDALKKAAGLPIQRLALHALRLSFIHPASGERISLEAPYPEDFAQTVSMLFA